MNEINLFNSYIEIELTNTGLEILNQIDIKEKENFKTLPKDSIVLYKNRIYNKNKLKTTIQEIMVLFGKKEYIQFCDEIPFKSNIKLL